VFSIECVLYTERERSPQESCQGIALAYSAQILAFVLWFPLSLSLLALSHFPPPLPPSPAPPSACNQELEAKLAQKEKEDEDRKKEIALKMEWEGRSVYIV